MSEEKNMLQIELESMKRVDLVSVAGRIDSSNAGELEKTLSGIIESGRFNIILELSQLTYMSSAGLRAIVSTLRECKKRFGDLRLAAPSERVTEVLDLAGLMPLFDIYEDTTAAVGSF
jgi:anti-sigma B factor antagonist